MPESKYSVDHYNILLAQILRSPGIAELALTQLDGSYFTNDAIKGSAAQAVMFNVIRAYYDTYGGPPDDGTLYTHVSDFVTRRVSNKTIAKQITDEVGRFVGFKKCVDERSEKHARDIIGHIAEVCVFRPTADKILAEAQTGSISGVADQLYDLEAKKAALSGGLSVNSLSGLELEDIGDRVSTNIPWLDSHFGEGRGPVRGSVMGIIAPQGAGKTTFGIQLAVRQALAHRHALLVLAEEGLTLPMRCKIFASALGIPYPEIEKAEGKTLGDKLRIALEASNISQEVAVKKVAAVDEYLHLLDLAQSGAEELPAIHGELQTLKNKGETPVYTYVDWAGIIADRMVQRSGRDRSKESCLKTISYTLTQYAQQSNSIIAVSQQMSPTVIQKGPFKLNDFTCAADCKGFTEPHKYVMVINKQDPKTKYQLMIIAKSRDDEALGVNNVVKLDGAIAAFQDLSDQYRVAGKRFKRVGNTSGGSSKIPSEHKAKSGEDVE